MTPNKFIVKDGRNVWHFGSVTIEGTEHRVSNYYVSCNSSLNHKAWNTTETERKCVKCFKSEPKQMELFL